VSTEGLQLHFVLSYVIVRHGIDRQIDSRGAMRKAASWLLDRRSLNKYPSNRSNACFIGCAKVCGAEADFFAHYYSSSLISVNFV